MTNYMQMHARLRGEHPIRPTDPANLTLVGLNLTSHSLK